MEGQKGWDIPWYSSFRTDFNYDFGPRSMSRSRPTSRRDRRRSLTELFGPRSRQAARSSSPGTACAAGTVLGQVALLIGLVWAYARAAAACPAGRDAARTPDRAERVSHDCAGHRSNP